MFIPFSSFVLRMDSEARVCIRANMHKEVHANIICNRESPKCLRVGTGICAAVPLFRGILCRY